MAKLRKAVAYRRIERPYTRRSKYREKSFVKAKPSINIVRFDMGNLTRNFSYSVYLMADSDVQIRHNALESARLTAVRRLQPGVGKANYHMKMRVYPHHILRENPLAAGAGADRMSTGMKHSFGKVIGAAAQVRKGQPVFQVDVEKTGIKAAKNAMRKASNKLPCDCRIMVEEKTGKGKGKVVEGAAEAAEA
ncbi:MAG: 50S ribosomal protein L16 [Candidatus Woesearchaeota archaeon]